ncbi:hypothetical protein [Nodularia sp. UHCC 0506]|uniref:hypothetical protein n=1 Tax=Nodularia sp. UHCC 0506 TaxID=3110243 RepID=UPI002B20CD24|nr:hypothetical protein [Nodularia sp. UHCC 0506]MEA5513602.1 hypothetical protein [Nodularia sp. UHCC 0506]
MRNPCKGVINFLHIPDGIPDRLPHCGHQQRCKALIAICRDRTRINRPSAPDRIWNLQLATEGGNDDTTNQKAER